MEGIKRLLLLKLLKGGGGTPTTITGNLPLILQNAKAKAISLLKRFGLCEQKSVDYLATVTQTGVCEQDGAPTPTVPVAIKCNNGRVVAGNCISNIPDGQGTFITPSELTTNRVYKTFPTDLVVGRSYTVTVTGTNWLIIVQQKKPDGTGSANVSGWVTTYDFAPEEGYIYGVAMRRSQDNITPADFNGTLTLDTTDGKPWIAGTPEVITDANGNTANAVNLLGVGDYADTQEFLSGAVGRQIGVLVFDGTENIGTSNACFTIAISDRATSKTALLCSHFPYSNKTSSQTEDMTIISFSSSNIGFRYDACADKTAFATYLATQYANGTPVIVVYPLATAATESVTGQMLVKTPLTVTAEVTVPTLATTTAPVSTPGPKRPLPIWCNNGKLEYGQYGMNIFDKNSPNSGGYYVGANGTITNASANATICFRCLPNTTYYYKHCSVIGGGRVFTCAEDEWDIGTPASNMVGGTTIDANAVRSITTPDDAKWIFFIYGRSGQDMPSFEEQAADFMVSLTELTRDTQYEPYHFGLHTDGTPEVLTVSGKNLINEAASVLGVYVNPTTGVIEENANYYTTEKMYLANGTYTYSQDRTGSGATNDRLNIATYNADDTPIELVYTSVKQETVTVTLSGSYAYVRISYRKTNTDIMLETGSTATDYQPYFEQTASVENLFEVNDYEDEQDVISGSVTRKVRVKILDGTEEWSASSAVSGVYLFYPADMKPCNPPKNGKSTHFKGTSAATASMADMTVKNTYGSGGAAVLCMRFNGKTSVADFKAWLAEQYANGTPVIVLYPLATETTEQTTPQHLHTTSGTNIVDSTSNVSPVEAEIKYTAVSG